MFRTHSVISSQPRKEEFCLPIIEGHMATVFSLSQAREEDLYLPTKGVHANDSSLGRDGTFVQVV